MKNIFTSSWFALTFAARTAPRTLGAVLLLQLVLAGFPAAQVWLVSALGRAIETGPHTPTCWRSAWPCSLLDSSHCRTFPPGLATFSD